MTAIGHTRIKDGRIGVQNRTFEVKAGRLVLDGATPEHIAYMLAHPSFTALPDETEATPTPSAPPAPDPKDAEIAQWKANAEEAKAAALALMVERDDWQGLAEGAQAELATLRTELATLRAAAAEPKTPDTEAALKRSPRGK